ncbi:MAG: DUF3105 domain-containing protein [Pseudonocardiaceae bacterium]
MPSGKSSKAVRNARSVVTATKPKPWGTVAAVVAVLVFTGVIFGYLYVRYDEGRDLREALAPFTPSAENQDPSRQIDGVVAETYQGSQHVTSQQRVAYDKSPPFGGPHDAVWAACNGVVYDDAVRTENLVHSLEHGAVWITYDPGRVSGEALASLQRRVEGQGYTVMSPYPGLDSPISLQSWGHQLELDSADDPRIDQFIRALRLNQYTYPEVGASCDAAPQFDVTNPPPFVAEPPGPGAVPMSGADATTGTGEMGGAQPPAGG